METEPPLVPIRQPALAAHAGHMRKRNKRILAGLVVTAALTGGALTLGGGGDASAEPLPTATAERRDLASRASATGNVAVPAQLNLGFAAGGRLTEVLVAPGTTVSAGQALARIDPSGAALALETAVADARAAEARLTSAQAGRPQAQADLDTATIAQARTAADGATAAVDAARAAASGDEAAAVTALGTARSQVNRAVAERDLAAAALAVATPETQEPARQRLSAAETAIAAAEDAVVASESALTQTRQRGNQAVSDAQAARTNAESGVSVAVAQANANASGTPAGAVAEAQAALDAARVAVTRAQRELDQTVLVAPAAGVVSAVNGRVGEQLPPGGGIGSSDRAAVGFVTLLTSGPLELKANFVEADAARLKVGQPATATLDALPGVTLQATVAAIDPASTVVNNVVNYGVRFTVTGTPPTPVRPGMTTAIDVVVETRTKVLVVPAAAVSQKDGQTVVLVPAEEPDATPVSRNVELGARGDGYIEVTSGIDEGTAIVLPESDKP